MANTDHVDNLLRSANLLARVFATVRTLALGAALVLVSFIAVLLFDAARGTSPTGLVLLDGLLVATALGVVVAVIAASVSQRYERRRIARWVEEQLGVRDSALINAVDLSTPPPGASPALAHKALSSANDLAWKTAASDAVPSRPVFVAIGLAFLAGLAIAALFLFAPRLSAMTTARLIDPYGDHPPYTLLDFSTTISPEKLYSGRPANIDVKITGPRLPEIAQLVFVEPSSNQTDAPSTPLFRRAAGEFTAELARLDAPVAFYIDTPLGRSSVQQLEPLATPTFESIQIVYEYPDYAGWPNGQGPLTSRGMEALVGTQASITVTSNLPLKAGRFTVASKRPADDAGATAAAPTVTTLTRSADDPKTVSGRFTIEADGRFELALTSETGAVSDETLSGIITAIPDGPPSVAITHPSPHTIAIEGSVIDVGVEARDDLGVGRVSLARSINGWGPYSIDLPPPSAAPLKFVKTRAQFDLGALGARPGDLITYFATAYDNRPEAQFRDTETYVIEVISLAEYREFARQQIRAEELAEKFAAIQKRMDQLKAEREKIKEELAQLRKKAKDEGLNAADQQRLKEVEKRLQQYAEQAQQLADDVQKAADEPTIYDAEESNREPLRRLQRELSEQAKAARQAAHSARKASQSPADQKQFDLDSEAFDDQESPFDQDDGGELAQAKEALEKLAKVDQLVAQGQRVESLIDRQRDLADRMAQFRSKEELSPEEKSRSRQFAREQERLQEELEDAATKLEQGAAEAQELVPNTARGAKELAEAIRSLQITDDQANSAKEARAGRGKPAFDQAESAANKLESLAGRTPSSDGAGDELAENDPGLGLSRGQIKNSLKQMREGRMPGPPGRGRQKGEQGEGQAGSRPKTTIVGPHMPMGRESDADAPRPGQNDGRGAATAGLDGGGPGDAESLSPEARAAGAGPASAMRGVPLGYREQVDAYFKRLAEE